MIRYALVCESKHEFEAWFASSDAYDQQVSAGLVTCPLCESTKVAKQIMAPAVAGTRKSASTQQALAELAGRIRNHIKHTHDYVGDRFATEAAAMHEGEMVQRPIYGEATVDEAKALKEKGVPAVPLPKEFVPTPPKKLN